MNRLVFSAPLLAALLATSAMAQEIKPVTAPPGAQGKNKTKDDPSGFALPLPEIPANHTNNPALNNLLEEKYVPPEVTDEVQADFENRDPSAPDKANEEFKQQKMQKDFAIQAKVTGSKVRGDGSKGSTFSKSGRGGEDSGETPAGLLPKLEGEDEDKAEAAAPAARGTPQQGLSKSGRRRGEPPGVNAPNLLDFSGPPDTGPRLEDIRSPQAPQALSKSGRNNPARLSREGMNAPELDAEGNPIPTEEELAEIERKKKEQEAQDVNELFNRLEQ